MDNRVRLHSAIGYIAPHDWMAAGKQQQIWAERDRRIEAARVLRAQRRAALGSLRPQSLSSPLEDACV